MKATLVPICMYKNALEAVADLVLQFGYRTTFHNGEAITHGGLSALETGFWVLKEAGCKMNSNDTIQVKNLLKFQERLEDA